VQTGPAQNGRMKRARGGVGLAAALGLLPASLVGGCASSGATTVVEPRDLDQAGGRPRINAVRDVGGIDIPSLGTLRPHASDGAAVIGEALWIKGSDFGRQPTVSIGGRSTAVVSRTGDGGILVRVPARTPAGEQPLVVTQEHGQVSFTIAVRRLGAVLAGGRLGFFHLGPDGPSAVPSGAAIAGGGFRQLQLSGDGRAAYALDQGGNLRVIDMAAQGGPAQVRQLELGAGEPRALLAAAAASRMLLVRKDDVVVCDIARPLFPALVGVHALPTWLRGDRVQGASLSPDGRWLALALAQKNRVVMLDADRLLGEGEPRLAELALVPEALAPVLVDLTFAPDARTLWVLSGGTQENRSLGPRATEVHAVRLQGHPGDGKKLGLERARVVLIEGADRPVALSTGRNLPLASGSAVRLPPERATVFVAAQATGSGGGPTIYAVGESEAASRLLPETGLTQVGRLDVTPDGTLVAGAFLGQSGDVRVTVARGDGRPGAVEGVVVLPGVATASTSASAEGLGTTELRLQP
jgi:hypothetical protein